MEDLNLSQNDLDEILASVQTDGLPISEKSVEAIEASESLLAFTEYTKTDYQSNWHHKLVCDYLDRFVAGDIKRLMINLGPRHGKLIADSTLVYTSDGWKKHGDLKKGDYVYHPSGKAIKILATSRKSPADVEIGFSNGEKIKCHRNHEWDVFLRQSNRRVMEAKDLIKRGVLGEEERKRNGKSKGYRSKFSVPLYEALEQMKKDLPIDPYWLGLWLGDGRSTAPYLTVDPKARDSLVKAISERTDYFISSEWLHADTKVPTVSYAKQGLLERLKKLDLVNNKHIPGIYLRSSIDQRLQLLAGLIDSDGCVDPKGRVLISTAIEKLRDGVLELLSTLALRPYIAHVSKHSSTTLPIKATKDCYAIGFQPYEDNIPTAFKKLTRISKVKRRVQIRSIRYLGESEQELGKCIQVDSEDGLYLVGRKFIPTHNSELCSRRLPAYIFGRDPNKKIISVSYGAELASRMNRDVQRIMTASQYKEIFPETRLWEKNVVTVADGSYLRNSTIFEIVNKDGVYMCAGTGGSLTGQGADIIVIDDPIKNAEEAYSKVYRDKVWDFYTSTLYTRLEKDGQILLIQTRWHSDDLSGRLLQMQDKDPAAEKWTVLTLPTICEDEDNPEDPRKIGEPLWPDKYSLKTLNSMKVTMGSRDWNALHRQKPTSESGDLFKRHYWKFYRKENLPHRFDMISISCDMAFKDTKKSDYVVMQVWGRWGIKFYLLDQVRDRMDFLTSLTALGNLVMKWPKYSECLIEDKANGTAIINVLQDKIPAVIPITPKESKEARAAACSPVIEAGNVYLPVKEDAPWVDDFIEELADFPKGKHDDMTDCLSQYLNRSARASGWADKLMDQIDVVDSLPMGQDLKDIFWGNRANG